MSELPRSLLYPALLVAGVAACPGDVTPPAAAVRSVSVGPSGASVNIGSTLQMTASVDADAGAATTVAWSSSSLAIATVGAATGLVTGVAAGSVAIKACSTVAGFTNVCGSTQVTVAAGLPATIQVTGATWVAPAGPTGCSPGAGPAVPITPTTQVRCQIEISVRVNSGDEQLERVEVHINGQVLASSTFSAVRGAAEPAGTANRISTAPISADITLSVNTQQVRRVSGILVPVVFNGNAAITANLFVIGSSTPIATPPIPAVMNNADAIVGLGTIGPIPVWTLTANTSTPTVTDAGGNVWFRGPSTFRGLQYLAFSTNTPTAVTFTSSLCGTSSPTVTGTTATGITLTGGFTCAGVEGANQVTGFEPPTFQAGATGPDGTPIVVPTLISNVGSAFSVPGDQRWNLNTPAVPAQVFPTLFTDNKPPVATIGTIAFNAASGQNWINSSTDVVALVNATDGGPIVGSTSIKTRQVRLYTTACSSTPLPVPHGLGETLTPDVYRVCGGATDFLDNLGLSAPSNNFGVENTPYTATVTGGYLHATGIPGVSFDCKLITTTPARPGATYTVGVAGPLGGGSSGVLPGQGPFTGTLDADGKARVVVKIDQVGTYRNTITVASPGGIIRSGTLDVAVLPGPGTCP